MSDQPGAGDDPVDPSALPSPLARLAAFAAIVIAGVCGALIGYALTDLSCDDGCPALAGGGAILGAVFAAGGVAILAVLVLRSMDEWKSAQR